MGKTRPDRDATSRYGCSIRYRKSRCPIQITKGYPVIINDPALTAQMLPTLENVAGANNNVFDVPKLTASENFAFYSQEVPSLFIFLDGTSVGQDASKAPYNHSFYFYADESSFKIGSKALSKQRKNISIS